MSQRSIYEIVRRPLLTEKGMTGAERNNQYRFEVARDANKIEIRRAVEKLFKVRVLRVNTQVRHGKSRRRGLAYHTKPDWKIAMVTVHPDQRIDVI